MVWLLHVVNGVAYAAVLYLVSAGLSLTYGVGGFLNLAHGGFYLLGATIALSVAGRTGFAGALVVAPVLVAGLAAVVERLLLRRLVGTHHALEQMLITFGIALVLSDVVRLVWGGRIRALDVPVLLSGSVDLGLVRLSHYRLALVAVGLAVAVGLSAVLHRTRAGATMRAAAADPQVAATLGIDPGRVLSLTYASGAGLAALGGVLGAPVIATSTGLDFATLLVALVVVVIGGLGDVRSTLWAALLVGVLETLVRAWEPRMAPVVLFAVLAAVLVARSRSPVARPA